MIFERDPRKGIHFSEDMEILSVEILERAAEIKRTGEHHFEIEQRLSE